MHSSSLPVAAWLSDDKGKHCFVGSLLRCHRQPQRHQHLRTSGQCSSPLHAAVISNLDTKMVILESFCFSSA